MFLWTKNKILFYFSVNHYANLNEVSTINNFDLQVIKMGIKQVK